MDVRSGRKLLLSIKNRFLFLLILVLAPVLIVQAVIYYDRYQDRRALALQSNLEVARMVAQAFTTFTNDIFRHELAIGTYLCSGHELTYREMLEILIISKADYPLSLEFSYVSGEGRVIASTRQEIIGQDISDRSYYQNIVSGQDMVVSDLMESKATHGPIFTVARAIRDSECTLLGVVVAAVEPDQFDWFFSVERALSGSIVLMDRQGRLVSRYPRVDLTWEDRGIQKKLPFLEKVFEGREISTIVDSPISAEKRMASFTPITSIGWIAGVGVSEGEAMAPILSALKLHAGVLFFVAFIAFLSALILSRNITSPIQKLREQALELGRGELKHPIEISGPAEIVDLAKSFKLMAERIRERKEDLLEIQNELERRVDERTNDLMKLNEALRAEIIERNKAEQSLLESEKELRFLSSRLLSAQEEERKRIAVEIHDSLGSFLSAIKISLENSRAQLEEGGGTPISLDIPISWTQRAIDEARKLMTDLRPSLLDDFGLLATMDWFFRQYRTTHPAIHVEEELEIEEPQIPEPLKIVIFRIMQEAFHNITKHSKAEFVSFSLQRRNGRIELSIEDNGDGFDIQKALHAVNSGKGLGLTSMKERAELSGGALRVESVLGEGTTIRASWSLDKKTATS